MPPRSGFDLSYTDNQMSVADVAAHFCRVLLESTKTITVTVLPCRRPGHLDAAAYAAAARADILAKLGPRRAGGVDWQKWDNRRMRDEWYGPDAAKVD